MDKRTVAKQKKQEQEALLPGIPHAKLLGSPNQKIQQIFNLFCKDTDLDFFLSKDRLIITKHEGK